MALTRAQKAAKAAVAAKAANTEVEPAAVAAPKKEFDSKGSMGPKIKAPVIHEHKLAGGGRTVTVVCKMPRGLYIQHHKKVSQDQRVVGGGIEKREVAMPIGPQIRLKPSVLAFGLIPNYTIVNGFSFTEVDANFWNTWYEQNQNFGMLEAGLLCAFDNEADARAYCKEYGSLQHGLEPLSQKDDPRVEQPTSQNLTELDIDTDVPGKR